MIINFFAVLFESGGNQRLDPPVYPKVLHIVIPGLISALKRSPTSVRIEQYEKSKLSLSVLVNFADFIHNAVSKLSTGEILMCGMLDTYLLAFKKLRTDSNRSTWTQATNYRSPYKPFLLLSVMDLIAHGSITETLLKHLLP